MEGAPAALREVRGDGGRQAVETSAATRNEGEISGKSSMNESGN